MSCQARWKAEGAERCAENRGTRPVPSYSARGEMEAPSRRVLALPGEVC